MSEIGTLDLKKLIGNAVDEVFETMLSMEVELLKGDFDISLNGDRIVGSVSFAGKVMGSIRIEVNTDFGRLITAGMLGMEPEEVEGTEEIYDVIGEMSNMIGGDLKSRLCDSGLPCELSIPSITSGKDFTIEAKDWVKHEKLGFRHQGHIGFLEVFMKRDV